MAVFKKAVNSSLATSDADAKINPFSFLIISSLNLSCQKRVHKGIEVNRLDYMFLQLFHHLFNQQHYLITEVLHFHNVCLLFNSVNIFCQPQQCFQGPWTFLTNAD
ncbi:hypothetical protein GOODEAATRI_015120 [Goodea atripinnis]|uniref:Neurofibromin n=1 Tax=Goodea atripinnis TaxID=208336 RepID=A0ABV0MSE1_9TELE